MQHHSINYLEFPSVDLAASEAFFSALFAWRFTSYGPDYSAFVQAGQQSLNGAVEGGFYRVDAPVEPSNTGAALVVFYSENLEQSLAAVERAGGTIAKAIFDFPGGRRFHFRDPSGNEFAIWSQAQ